MFRRAHAAPKSPAKRNQKDKIRSYRRPPAKRLPRPGINYHSDYPPRLREIGWRHISPSQAKSTYTVYGPAMFETLTALEPVVPEVRVGNRPRPGRTSTSDLRFTASDGRKSLRLTRAGRQNVSYVPVSKKLSTGTPRAHVSIKRPEALTLPPFDPMDDCAVTLSSTRPSTRGGSLPLPLLLALPVPPPDSSAPRYCDVQCNLRCDDRSKVR